MKKQPQPAQPAAPLPPLGPPNYHGPTGQITAETLALVARLGAIRQAMREKRNAERR